jgi:hypothetical protein
MTPLLPPPGEPAGDAPKENGSRPGEGTGPVIPGVEEILRKLLQLNGLVAVSLLSTAQATVIQRSLRIVLDAQLRRAPEGTPGLPQEALAELCRHDPRVVEMLEPFLTDAQVQWLMAQAGEGGGSDQT